MSLGGAELEVIPDPPTLADVADWESLPADVREAELRGSGVFDGLPLASASRAQVEESLRMVSLGPDDVVATLPPLSRPATAAAVAACSLLAGCEPAHFPVVLAGVRAIAAAPFNGMGVFTTTGSAAVVLIVSGPAASAFNAGANLLGPGHRSNATVGRAIGLIARVVGGAVPGLVDMATMGQPGKYTFCLAENEAASPWEPLHVGRGVQTGGSAVTVFAGSGTTEATNAHAATAGAVLATLAASLYQPGTLDPDRRLVGGGRALVLLSPEWASILAREGLSREAVCHELAERAAWPVEILPPELRELAAASATAGQRLRAVGSPRDVVLVVAGGVGIKQTVIPGWAGGSEPVTLPI